MMQGIEGYGWGMGWWWIIGPIIVVVVVWMVVKSMSKNSKANLPSGKSALDILKERSARGEIDKEEFEERRKDLI